jgi:hypothetical protein
VIIDHGIKPPNPLRQWAKWLVSSAVVSAR